MPEGGRGSTIKADPVEVEMLKLRVAARMEMVEFYFRASSSFDKLVKQQNRELHHTLRTVASPKKHEEAVRRVGKQREQHIHKMRARSLSAGRQRCEQRLAALDKYTDDNREALTGKDLSAEDKAVVQRERGKMQPDIPSYREVYAGKKVLSTYRDPVMCVTTLRPYSAPAARTRS
jgi:hypothetical protein